MLLVSTVDYCNVVLYGVPAKVNRRLQAVLHAAARLITGVRRNQHITATLRDTLHWLPVPQRILFKVALMAFDCVHVVTLMMSLCQFTLSELVHDCDLPITVTWSFRVRAQFASVSAASAHLHHQCGTQDQRH